MTADSLTVAEVLSQAQQAVVTQFPGPIWVRGEVTSYRRTSGGAAFFRLADPAVDDAALDVAGRGRVMMEVDRVLGNAGVGGLRDGVEVRVRGTVGVDGRSSILRLALLEIDPAFTAGRLAIDRAEVLRKMKADGSLDANRSLPRPLVPLRVGLVTSRGSAAHGDFTDQLRRSPFRFGVKTAHVNVQGGTAVDQLTRALARFTPEIVDMVALVRGGGSRLDLAVFDNEAVARAVAAAPVPVITGIGHDMDRSVADEAAAIAEKTPSAAGEWLVARVKEYSDRLDRARVHIREESRNALGRHRHVLARAASDIVAGAGALHRRRDSLDRMSDDIAAAARRAIERQGEVLESMQEWFSAVDLDGTLRRGFAVVTDGHGQVVKSAAQLSPGERLRARFADGTVDLEVIEP